MNIRISVAMAVYNGERFLEQQIDSILNQLGRDDELIISVDPCSDSSKNIALKHTADSRVRVIDGPGKGVIRNFENALRIVNGKYVFLSDQDDVWRESKVNEVLKALQRDDVIMVIHDAEVTDENLKVSDKRFFEGSFNTGILKNIIRNRYVGCCMAFRRELLDYALPFPEHLPMHDQWLGIIAKKHGEVAYIERPLVLYRRHAGTATGRERNGILTRIKWRVNITAAFLSSSRRIHN